MSCVQKRTIWWPIDVLTEGINMEETKQKALESAGWQVGDAADFLEMSDEERQLLDTKIKLEKRD